MYIKSNMITTTLSGFRKEMKKYLDLVTRDYETLVINRGKDIGVVIISVEEYNSIKATEYELSSKINEKRLESAIGKLERGDSFEKELIDP
jgi:antitoxin YefM